MPRCSIRFITKWEEQVAKQSVKCYYFYIKMYEKVKESLQICMFEQREKSADTFIKMPISLPQACGVAGVVMESLIYHVVSLAAVRL